MLPTTNFDFILQMNVVHFLHKSVLNCSIELVHLQMTCRFCKDIQSYERIMATNRVHSSCRNLVVQLLISWLSMNMVNRPSNRTHSAGWPEKVDTCILFIRRSHTLLHSSFPCICIIKWYYRHKQKNRNATVYNTLIFCIWFLYLVASSHDNVLSLIANFWQKQWIHWLG